jgi:hypothetical protein
MDILSRRTGVSNWQTGGPFKFLQRPSNFSDQTVSTAQWLKIIKSNVRLDRILKSITTLLSETSNCLYLYGTTRGGWVTTLLLLRMHNTLHEVTRLRRRFATCSLSRGRLQTGWSCCAHRHNRYLTFGNIRCKSAFNRVRTSVVVVKVLLI